MNFKKIFLILIILLNSTIFINARLLDVMIAFDSSEATDSAMTISVRLALCQKSSPIIVPSHLIYNILKRKLSGDEALAKVNFDEWDVYESVKHHTDESLQAFYPPFYLLIPKTYRTSITEKYDTPEFNDRLIAANTELKTEYSKEEALIGFRIDPRSNIFRRKNLSEFNSLAEIEHIPHDLQASPTLIETFFVTGKDIEIFGIWNIILTGHGGSAANIPKNLSMQSAIEQFDASKATIAGMDLASFRAFLQFLIKKINVNFLYYLTCSGGDVNLILPYLTSIINAKGNILGNVQQANFTIVSGALTSGVVWLSTKLSAEKCLKKEKIDVGEINYAKYFDLVHKYSKQEGVRPTLFKPNELRDILVAITPRTIVSGDKYGISALPSVMFPKTDVFRAVSLNDKIFIISNTLVKTHQLEADPEKKAININNKEVILVYPESIPVEVNINSSPEILPDIVSMLPGINIHKFEKINMNIDFARFKKIWATIPVFNKYFYIKELTLTKGVLGILGITNNLRGNRIVLTDVFIVAYAKRKHNQTKPFFHIIFTNPVDQIIYEINNDDFLVNPLKHHKTNTIPNNDFLNAMFNYFYLNTDIKQEFDFDLLKTLFTPEEQNILATQPVPPIINPAPPVKPVDTLFNELQKSGLIQVLKVKNKTVDQIRRNPNLPLDANGTTALMLAAVRGNINLANILLKMGANRNAKNKQGLTAFNFARARRNTTLMKLLQPSAPVPQFKPGSLEFELQRSGIMPLLNQKKITIQQVRKNPNLSLDANGTRLLMMAANRQSLNLAKALLQIGANKKVKNKRARLL